MNESRIKELTNQLRVRYYASARDGEFVAKKADAIDRALQPRETPAPEPADPWPMYCDMLYAGGFGKRYPGQTLHLPLLPESRVELAIRTAPLAGHTHVAVCVRSGLDGRHSFGLDGEYDFLREPPIAKSLLAAIVSAGCEPLVFLGEDDDRTFNRNTLRWQRGVIRFLVWFYDAFGYLPPVVTQIEADETWGEQSLPSRVAPETTRAQAERINWLAREFPGLPLIGVHTTTDKLLVDLPDMLTPEAREKFFYAYQAHARNHDGSWRGEAEFQHEFGPNTDNGKPRPGKWAADNGVRLMLMEVADDRMTGDVRDAMLRGAMAGADEAGYVLSSGIGRL